VVRAVNEGRLFAYVSKPWEPHDLRIKVSQAAEHYRLARELAEERQLLHDLMDNIPDGIYFKDLDLRYRRANAAFGHMRGADPGYLLGKTLREIAERHSDADEIEAEERELLSTGRPLLDSPRRSLLLGSDRWLSESKAPVRSLDGHVIGLVGITRDITSRRKDEQRNARLARMRTVTSSINSAILRHQDPAALLAEVCRVAVEVGDLGIALVLEGAPGATEVLELARAPADSEPLPLDPRDLELWRLSVAGDVEGGHVLQSRQALLARGLPSFATFALSTPESGDRLLVLLSREPGFFSDDLHQVLREGADNLVLALDRIGQSKRIQFLSYHDPLTGLPNRRLLVDRITQQLIAHQRGAQQLALVLVDLGRFRQINDALGRTGGDQLLTAVAGRLAELEGIAALARFEGNVFALLLPAVDSESEAASFVETKLSDAFQETFLVGNTQIQLSTRSGIALFPSDGTSAESLIGSAEAALRKAKTTVQPYLFYAPAMNARVAEQMALETNLRRAVTREEFVLFYQPKVDMRSGRVVGLEALLRWQDPERGLVPPGQFIPVLEETGLIREVGRWVLERAALQYRDWSRLGVNPPRVAVNVSGLQLAARDFVARMDRVLQNYPPGGSGIDFEITESVFVEDLAGSTEKLRAARERGLRVAIDDFGTGYSSLSYLARLPIDALKIDRTFVSRMTDEPQSTSIVTTIISLAHALELKVIAEGVETRQQAQFLRLLKCDEVQGFLFSKPVPASDVPALLGRRFTPSTIPPP
jgi:diguanylate cyclase (GGDEF)-like protein/PAS domain S-box-containing protein